MSNTGNNKQIDPDILQCKADILRARAITPFTPPPLVKKGAGQSEVPRFDLAEEIMAEQRKITAIRRKAPGVSRKAGASSHNAGAQKTNSTVSTRVQSQRPFGGERFDKLTALSEPVPSTVEGAEGLRASEPQTAPVSHTIEQPTTGQPEQEQIIAEIVARDIEELCRGDYSVKAN